MERIVRVYDKIGHDLKYIHDTLRLIIYLV